MSPLCNELKAFEKSSLRNTLPSCILSKYLRAECIAASHPPALPTPNCCGLKYWAKRERPNEFANLDTSLLRVKPITMGRSPPDFLFKANRRPPKKTLVKVDGQRPERMAFENPVIAEISSGPEILLFTRTFKCCGLRPSGPPADPAGKEEMA